MIARRAAIPSGIVARSFTALYRVGVPLHRAERAYKRWRAGRPHEPCKYGREQAYAIECKCEGCIETLCFLYFDHVAARFGVTA